MSHQISGDLSFNEGQCCDLETPTIYDKKGWYTTYDGLDHIPSGQSEVDINLKS